MKRHQKHVSAVVECNCAVCIKVGWQNALDEQNVQLEAMTDPGGYKQSTSMGVPFRSLPMPSAAKSSPMPFPLGNLHATGPSHWMPKAAKDCLTQAAGT